MLKSIKVYLSALLLLSMVMTTSQAMAIECYTPSPNLTSSGDNYYGLDHPKPLSNVDSNKVNALFRAMSGNWTGDMQYRECRGPDRAPRIITRQAAIKAKAKLTSTTGLEINAEKNDINSRTKKPEHLLLMGKTPTFNVKFISDNHVIFAERHRRLNQVGVKEAPPEKSTLTSKLKAMLPFTKKEEVAPVKPKTSRLTETIVEIVMNNGSLLLARRYYSNGVYIGEEHWLMQAN